MLCFRCYAEVLHHQNGRLPESLRRDAPAVEEKVSPCPVRPERQTGAGCSAERENNTLEVPEASGAYG